MSAARGVSCCILEYMEEPIVELTESEFEQIREYFEFALVAISDEEQTKLVGMEYPLRELVRAIADRQTSPQQTPHFSPKPKDPS